MIYFVFFGEYFGNTHALCAMLYVMENFWVSKVLCLYGCNQATPPLNKFSVIIDVRTHTHTLGLHVFADLGLHVFEKYALKKECTALSLSRIGMHANKDEFIEDSKSS